MKFGRSYRLKIEYEGETVIITNPITIQFTVQRVMGSSLNVFKADLYNLSENVRNFLFQEPWVNRDKKITFEAGYDTLSVLFTGNIWSGNSYREGSDIVTSIECKSEIWELNETTIYETIDAGQTIGDVIRFLCGKYKGIQVGAIGDFPEVIQRPVVLNGNVWEILKKYSGNTAFLDNGRIYVLKRSDVIDGDFLTVTPKSGLLATPRREMGILQIQMLFEPRIVLSQMLGIEASASSIYNGTYKVVGIQHTGIISNAIGGECRTLVDLFVDGRSFKTVKQIG